MTNPNYQTPVPNTDKKRKLKVYGLPILAGTAVFLLGLFIGIAVDTGNSDDGRGPRPERDNRPGISQNEESRPNDPKEERDSKHREQMQHDEEKKLPETSPSSEPNV